MQPKDLNLPDMKSELQKTLQSYGYMFRGLDFGQVPDFGLTPNKPNSARTVFPVTYKGVDVANMYVIAFLYKDGTGDNLTYQKSNLIIPKKYWHEEKTERVFPRKKKINWEAMFPFFTMDQHGTVFRYAASLEELTVVSDGKSNDLIKKRTIGQNQVDYRRSLDGEQKYLAKPDVWLTVGLDDNGEKIGDPHAIYCNTGFTNEVQVVGFLEMPDNHKILEIARHWRK